MAAANFLLLCLPLCALATKPDVYALPAEMKTVLTGASPDQLNISATLPIHYRQGSLAVTSPIIEIKLLVQGFANGSAFTSRVDYVSELNTPPGTPAPGGVGSLTDAEGLPESEDMLTVIQLHYSIPAGAGVDDILRVTAQVDSANGIDERDEGNNNWVVPVRVSSLGCTLISIVPDLSGSFPYDLPIQNDLEVTLDGILGTGESIQYAVENAPTDGIESALDGETSTPSSAYRLGNTSLYKYTLPLSMGLFEKSKLDKGKTDRDAPVYVWIKRSSGIRTQMRKMTFKMVLSETVLRLTNAARGLTPFGKDYDEAAETASSSSKVADPLVRGDMFRRLLAPSVRPSPFTLSYTFPSRAVGSAMSGSGLGTLLTDTWLGGASARYGITVSLGVSVQYTSADAKLTRRVDGGMRLYLRDSSLHFPVITAGNVNAKSSDAVTDISGAAEEVGATIQVYGAELFAFTTVPTSSGLPAPVPYRLKYTDWNKELRLTVQYSTLPLAGLLPVVENFWYATLRFGAKGGSTWADDTASLQLTAPLLTALPTVGTSHIGVNVAASTAQGGAADIAVSNSLTIDFTLKDNLYGAPILSRITANYQLAPASEAALSVLADTKGTGTAYSGASGKAVTHTVEASAATAFSNDAAATAADAAWAQTALSRSSGNDFDSFTRVVFSLGTSGKKWSAVADLPWWSVPSSRVLENSLEAVCPLAHATVYEGRAGSVVTAAPRLQLRTAKGGAASAQQLNVAVLPLTAVPGAETISTPQVLAWQPDLQPSFAIVRHAATLSATQTLQKTTPFADTWGFVAFTRLQMAKFGEATAWENAGAYKVVTAELNTADVVVALLNTIDFSSAQTVTALPISNVAVKVTVAAGSRVLQAAEPECDPLPQEVKAASTTGTVERLVYKANGFDGYPALAVSRVGTGQMLVPVDVMTDAEIKDTWEHHLMPGVLDVSKLVPAPQDSEVDPTLGASPCCASDKVPCKSSYMPCNILKDLDNFHWRQYKVGTKANDKAPVTGISATFTLEFAKDIIIGAESSIKLSWAIPPLAYKLTCAAAGATTQTDLPGASIDVTTSTPAPTFALGAPIARVDTFKTGTQAAGEEWDSIRCKKLVIDIPDSKGWPGSYKAKVTDADDEKSVAYSLGFAAVTHTAVLPRIVGVVAYIKDGDDTRLGDAPWAGAQLQYSKWSDAAVTYGDRKWSQGKPIPSLATLLPVDRAVVAFGSSSSVALLVVPTSAAFGNFPVAHLRAVAFTPEGDAWSAVVALGVTASSSYRGVVILPAQPSEPARSNSPANSQMFHVAAIEETLSVGGSISAQTVRYWLCAAVHGSAAAPVVLQGPIAVLSGQAALGVTALDLASTVYGIALAATVSDHVVVSELYLAPKAQRGSPAPPSTVYNTALVWSEPVQASVPLSVSGDAPAHTRLSSVRVSQARRESADASVSMKALLLEYTVTTQDVSKGDSSEVFAALATPKLRMEKLWLHGIDGQGTGYFQVMVLVSNIGASRSAPAQLEVYKAPGIVVGGTHTGLVAGNILEKAIVPEIPAGGNWTVVVPVLVSKFMAGTATNDIGVQLKYAKEDVAVLTVSSTGAYSLAVDSVDDTQRAFLPVCTLGVTVPSVHPLVGVTFTIVNQGVCMEKVELKYGAGATPSKSLSRNVAPFSTLIETVKFSEFAGATSSGTFTVQIDTRDVRDGLVNNANNKDSSTAKNRFRLGDEGAAGLPNTASINFQLKQLYIPASDGLTVSTGTTKITATVRVVNVGLQGMKASLIHDNIAFEGDLDRASKLTGCNGACNSPCTFVIFDGRGAPIPGLNTEQKCTDAMVEPGQSALFFSTKAETFVDQTKLYIATVSLKSAALELFVSPPEADSTTTDVTTSRFSYPSSSTRVIMAWDGAPVPELEIRAEVRPPTGAQIAGLEGTVDQLGNA